VDLLSVARRVGSLSRHAQQTKALSATLAADLVATVEATSELVRSADTLQASLWAALADVRAGGMQVGVGAALCCALPHARRLFALADRQVCVQLLAAYFVAARDSVRQHRGTIVSVRADALLCVFPDARSAVRGAGPGGESERLTEGARQLDCAVAVRDVLEHTLVAPALSIALLGSSAASADGAGGLAHARNIVLAATGACLWAAQDAWATAAAPLHVRAVPVAGPLAESVVAIERVEPVQLPPPALRTRTAALAATAAAGGMAVVAEDAAVHASPGGALQAQADRVMRLQAQAREHMHALAAEAGATHEASAVMAEALRSAARVETVLQ
jgi:hypothetical protein